MIQLEERRDGVSDDRPKLASVPCAICGHPVSHMARTPRGMAGGMCTRATCRKNTRSGKDREVYTFNRLVDEL